jgi:D-arabinose 1-dehydrogenase-like Zn-dependent alcohol dehydrogenase
VNLRAPGAQRRYATRAAPGLLTMRAVQITRFGGPEVMDIVELPDPTPGPGQQLYEVSSAGVNFADTHHRLSSEVPHVDCCIG